MDTECEFKAEVISGQCSVAGSNPSDPTVKALAFDMNLAVPFKTYVALRAQVA